MAALSTSSPWYLTVNAGKLKNGAGVITNLKGVNVYGGPMPYDVPLGNGQTWGTGAGQLNEQCKWMTRLDVITAMKTQLGSNCNVIRVPFSPLMFDARYPEQLQRANDLVARCATLGIWVLMCPYGMAEYGDIASRKSTDEYQDETNAAAITTEVMACHDALAPWSEDKPNVLINLLNEPRRMLDATWQTQAQTWIANLRAKGYARPIFVDGPDWATRLNATIAATMVAADSQLVFLAHHYEDSGNLGQPQGFTGSSTFWPGYLAAKTAGLAIGFGEYGARVIADTSYPGPQAWSDTTLAAYGDIPVKIIWMWPPHDGNSMVGQWLNGVWASIQPGAPIPPPLNTWGAYLADKFFGVTQTVEENPTNPTTANDGIYPFGSLKVALATLKSSLPNATTAVVNAVTGGRVRIMRGTTVCADGPATITVDSKYVIHVAASTLTVTSSFASTDAGLRVVVCNTTGTSGFIGYVDGFSYALTGNGAAGSTVTTPEMLFSCETTWVAPIIDTPTGETCTLAFASAPATAQAGTTFAYSISAIVGTGSTWNTWLVSDTGGGIDGAGYVVGQTITTITSGSYELTIPSSLAAGNYKIWGKCTSAGPCQGAFITKPIAITAAATPPVVTGWGVPAVPTGQVWTPYTLPAGVTLVEEIKSRNTAPVWWAEYAMGLCYSWRKGGDTSWPDTPFVPFRVNRTWDSGFDDADWQPARNQLGSGDGSVCLQWAGIDMPDGTLNTGALFKWINLNSGKLWILTIGGVPTRHQTRPGTVNGRYPYLPGGTSASKPGTLKTFLQRLRAAIVAEFGDSGLPWMVEPVNEPLLPADTSLDSRLNISNPFYSGSANEMAYMIAEAKDSNIAPLVGFGAYEGKYNYRQNAGTGAIDESNSATKFMRALANIGRLDAIDVITFHPYNYNGVGSWRIAVTEAKSYMNFASTFNLPNVKFIMSTEDGAESPVKLETYSQSDRAKWVERKLVAGIASGSRSNVFYNARASDRGFAPEQTQMNAIINDMHQWRDSWIYEAAVVSQGGEEKLYYSTVKNGQQRNRII